MCWGEIKILAGVSREGSGEDKGKAHGYPRKSISGRGNNKRKGPEVGAHLACSSNSEKASVVKAK